MNDLILELGGKVGAGLLTWREATAIFNKQSGENINGEALRKRYSRRKGEKPKAPEYETIYGSGEIEAQKIVNLPPEIKKDQRAVLKALGYDSNEWEIIYMQFSNWQQHTKEQSTKNLYAVKFKLRPRVNELGIEEALKLIDENILENVKPFKIKKQPKNKLLDEDKVMLLGAVELHLGKEAREFDVGENYNVDIAIERYEAIVSAIIEEQEQKQVGKLVYGVGNDFINIDTPSNTTTKGTPQSTSISSYELFDIGLKLQLQSLMTLREHFNEIEVILVKGNHSNTLEYTLYRALQQRFSNDSVIGFRDDYKDVQAIKEGNTSIFMTHGDTNYKRTIEAMSKEFYKIYGDTEHRYILLGHLHHKQKIEELNGFTVFRLSSPSGIDRWHYKERYMSPAGQEIFTFDKEDGLVNVKYLSFHKK